VAPAIAAAIVVGYLLGSIPFGLLVSKRLGGRDLREFGSGKTGFTNSLRVVGLKRSVPVFTGDLLKGLLAALIPLLWTDEPWVRALGGLAAVVGHVWPVFAGFRGGRGVLTGGGVVLGLCPIAALVVVPIAAVVIAVTRYVSLASITACALAGPVAILLAATGHSEWAYAAAVTAGGWLIVAVHHDNIVRLRAGTERRLGKGGERRTEVSGA
jgi:glycerol-3-phosphate acyltransferase PlsY